MVTRGKNKHRTIAAIGNFDGVHRGHQYLLKTVRTLSDQHHSDAGVVLFDPHPRRYFQPETPAFLLTSPQRRDELLRACAIDQIFSLPFNEALASLSAQAFVEDVLLGELSLAGIIVGSEFRFGKGRAGNAAMLQDLCQAHGTLVHIIDPVPSECADEGKIGSSLIRNAIMAGDIKTANQMLGRTWDVSGTVVKGQQLGRTLGFATANLYLGEMIAPRHGVYAVMINFKGQRFAGVANFGRKPTVGINEPLLEVHLFDFKGDLYGEEISVEFVDFLREEKRFDGLDALKAQISLDCDAARTLLAQ